MSIDNIIEFCGGRGFFVYLCAITIVYIFLDAYLRQFSKKEPEERRWLVNFTMYMVNSGIAYWLLSQFDFQVELSATNSDFGLFKYLSDTPLIIQFLSYAILLDFFVYWLHRLSHNWRPLWRLHIVHHSDRDLDFSVSFRFHPLERMLDIPLVMAASLLLGVNLWILLVYNITYSFFAFFPHSNMRVSEKLDRVLRWVVVTPSMHRVHHSSNIIRTNSNYGDVFSFWDRVFGTYQHLTLEEHKNMELGLEYFRKDKDQTCLAMILQPFTYKGSMKPPSNNLQNLDEG